MGEKNPAMQPESESRKFARLRDALYFAPAGAIMGVYAANELYPPTVEIAPELSVEASLATGNGAIIPLGPPGELNFPAMGSDLPGPWNAVKLDVSNPHNVHIPKDLETWIDKYGVGLFTHTDSSIVAPIKHALIERFILGASIGAIIGGALGAVAIDYARLRLDKNKKEPIHPSDNPETPRPKRQRWRKYAKPLTGLLLAGSFAGGLVHSAETSRPSQKATPLPSELTTLNEALEGATIRGPLDKLPSTLVDAFVEAKKEADNAFTESAENFTDAYTDFVQNNRRYRQLRANPNIRSLLHGSDLHCNFAYAENEFGTIISSIQPTVFMNTGDTQIYSGTVPIEDGCFPAFLKELSGIPMVNVNGNHDKKESVDDTVTLNKDNDYHARVEGIDFVGDNDPENTSWNATHEDDKDDLDKESVKRGKHIADTACDIAEETGVKPIALAHRWQMLAESITRGCVVIANSGHLHKEPGMQSYEANDGTVVLEHTAGSATGTGTSVSYFYNKSSTTGYLMEQLYDQTSNTFVGFVTYVFNTDGSVHISFKNPPLPTKNTFPTRMSSYLDRQSETHQDTASVDSHTP